MTLRLRYQAFKAMMRQEMGWFDEEEHSTGALTSALADDTRNVQGVSHTKTDGLWLYCFPPASPFTMSDHTQWRVTYKERSHYVA